MQKMRSLMRADLEMAPVNLVLMLCAERFGTTPGQIVGAPHYGSPAAVARTAAAYILVVYAGLQHRDVADFLGMVRRDIGKKVQWIERERDRDAVLDRWLEDVQEAFVR